MIVLRFVSILFATALLLGCPSNEQHAERNEFYRNVKTAMVHVQGSSGAHQGAAPQFTSYMEAWLRIANIAVLDDKAGKADVVIRVVAENGPVKAGAGARKRGAGARLHGVIQIERPSVHRDEAPFAGLEEFSFRLAGLMGRYFGRGVLLIALDDYNSKGLLRESAIEALASLGMPSIPYLVDSFIYCSPECEKGVGEALERITGKKYGSDAKLWNEWLRKEYPKWQTSPGRGNETTPGNRRDDQASRRNSGPSVC